MKRGQTVTRAQCNDRRDHLVCDKPFGHLGPHRGYDPQIDEALFWRNELDAQEACPGAARGQVSGALK